jgi:hypothetical protein
MLGLSKPAVRVSVPNSPNSPGRTQDLYQRYAAALYRQALLTLDDRALAQQVVCDAIVEECAAAPGPGPDEDEARCRLAESVFRHCQQQSVAAPAGRDRRHSERHSPSVVERIDPGRVLSRPEREALGLVLFGGLGYVRAGRALGIDPHDMAVLLRAVLLKLATSSASVEGDSQE